MFSLDKNANSSYVPLIGRKASANMVHTHDDWRHSTMRKLWIGCLVLALGLVALQSCADPVGLTAVESTALAGTGFSIASSRAGDVPVKIERRVREALARAFSIAIQSDSMRREVYQALHESPYREHKVHFRPFLEGAGIRILARMAAQLGKSHQSVIAMSDSAIDMAIYMPVHKHYESWNGDENVMVATLAQDHEVPAGYRLGGRPVPGMSATVPPEMPALALVPPELDFSLQPASLTASNSQLRLDGMAIVMTDSYLYLGSYEGWGMGDPEFEIFTSKADSGINDAFVQRRCSGAEGGTRTDYYYDQNSGVWHGSALLTPSSDVVLADSLGWKFMWQMWEDDVETCLVHSSIAADAWALFLGGVGATAFGVGYLFEGEVRLAVHSFVLAAAAFVSLVVHFGQSDDFVGQFMQKSDDPEGFFVINNTNDTVGQVRLSGFVAPFVNPYPPALTITINGYSELNTNQNQSCSWYAGGAPEGSQYSWKRDGNEVSTSSSYTSGDAGSSFSLELTVIHGDDWGTGQMTVSVSDGGPQCLAM
jgi:hypothetical protein